MERISNKFSLSVTRRLKTGYPANAGIGIGRARWRAWTIEIIAELAVRFRWSPSSSSSGHNDSSWAGMVALLAAFAHSCFLGVWGYEYTAALHTEIFATQNSSRNLAFQVFWHFRSVTSPTSHSYGL